MQKKIPMRRCIGCMESKPKKELARIVIENDNIIYDKSGRANGRGAYICKNINCFEEAIKKQKFQREFSMQISVEIFEKLRRDIFIDE